MILAFSFSDIIRIPFGYLLDWLYQFTANYGVALIFFALLVKVILFPVQAKAKKSMMKMSRLTPRMQKIQQKYADDPQKQNEAMQALYRDEGVSMTGGCLWSFVPLLIMLPLYHVIRQPIVYMMHESAEVAQQIIQVIKTADPSLFTSNAFYDEMTAARHIPEFVDAIKAAGIALSDSTLAGLNFEFLGIDLGAVPAFNIFGWSAFDWAHIGAFLLPVISAGSQVFAMWISQKMNNSLITNDKGVQDAEAAKNSQVNQSTKVMMWMMPLMSLWIGFTICGALSLYWLIQGILSIVQDVYLTKRYRKIYDAEDAARLQKALEEEAIEAEKERIRAERRAANPDGITSNTSKKKMHKQQQMAENAAKVAAKKEYDAKRGIVEEEETESSSLSGISDRPYCKGRAYDPNRYSSTTMED